MKPLYHFCPKWMLAGIVRDGLTKGSIPFMNADGKVMLRYGYQWLTMNPDFNQSWNEGSSLPYDRTECRLLVTIPPGDQWERLIPWLSNCQELSNMHVDLNSYGDPENWIVFRGKIPVEWLCLDAMKKDSKIRFGRMP